jgi:uncharacterized protein (TIGR02246 family)
MTTARDSIEATIKALTESLNGGDAAGVAAHYTDDAALLPPNAARIDGREGIQGAWQALIDSDVRDVALTTQEVAVFGDVSASSVRQPQVTTVAACSWPASMWRCGGMGATAPGGCTAISGTSMPN